MSLYDAIRHYFSERTVREMPMTMTEPRIAQQSQGQTHKSRRSIYRDGEGHIDHSYVAGLAYERMVKAGKNPFGFQHKNSSDLVEQRI